MSLGFDDPVWVWVGAAFVVAALSGWWLFRGLPVSRRVVAVGSRAVLMMILALALGGARIERSSDRMTVMVVTDVSGSVRGFGAVEGGASGLVVRALGADRVQEDETRREDDRVGVVMVDESVRVGRAARSAPIVDLVSEGTDGGTDLSGAIRRASALIGADSIGRVVVVSDGVGTTGPIGDLEIGHPVDVIPIEYEVDREVVVESVRAPSRSVEGAVVPIEVALRASSPARGVLRLFVNGVGVDLDPDGSGDGIGLALSGGLETVRVSARFGEGRVHRIRALWEPEVGSDGVALSDTSAHNNEGGALTLARGGGRALIVGGEGAGADVSYLERVLVAQGWDVDVRIGSGAPSAMIELERFDLVVVANTAYDSVSSRFASALDTYVRELGGGVVFTGGTEALGAGGWQAAGIDALFPVELEVEDDVVRSRTAVVFVLDSSGSMRRGVLGSSRSQQSIANESAAKAVELLDPTDQIGVISFSNSAREVVELRRNDDPERIQRSIRGISADGGTNLGPAMDLAGEWLEGSEAQTRHVVVLSDGESQNSGALPGIAQRLGQQGIRVSTITIGDQADETTMRQIAEQSGGVYYRVVNPSVLPSVFLKAVRVIQRPMVREGVITTVVVEPGSALSGGFSAPTALGGIVMSGVRTDDPRIETVIVSDQGEPVLTGHQYELGRVSVFTGDVGAWSSGWIESGAMDGFLANVCGWTARAPDPGIGEVRTSVDGRGVGIVWSAQREDGSPIDGARVSAKLYGASGAVREIDLIQSGPGEYSGRAEGIEPGESIVIVRPEIEGSAQRPTIAGVRVERGGEFARLTSDRGALERLARNTGGRVIEVGGSDRASYFDRSGLAPVVSSEPIWWALVGAALLVFLVDLGSRRVAWDRWIAQAREETIAVTRGSAREAPRRPIKGRAATGWVAPEIEERGDEGGDTDALLDAKRRARARYLEGLGDRSSDEDTRE